MHNSVANVNRILRIAILLVFCVALVAVLIHQATTWAWTTKVQAVASPLCGTWDTMTGSKLDLFGYGGRLHGVAAISRDDIWIVGNSDARGGDNSPLFIHWDGSNLNTDNGAGIEFKDRSVQLNDVAAIQARDVWAVGSYMQREQGGRSQPLTAHWNGKNWAFVPGPQIAAPKIGALGGIFGTYNMLNAVSTVSEKDAWAVGTYKDNHTVDRTLIEHWNGTQWEIISSPNIGDHKNVLYDITAISPRDIWAAGYYDAGDWVERELFLHWNGDQWSTIAPGDVTSPGRSIHGLSAISPDNVWAVGVQALPNLIEHWNGKSWQIIPSPDPAPVNGSELQRVAAISANDVWAVGKKEAIINSQNQRLSMILHWDGTNWIEVPAPNPSGAQYLQDIAVISPNDLWAVGVSVAHDILDDPPTPMIVHFVGCSNHE